MKKGAQNCIEPFLILYDNIAYAHLLISGRILRFYVNVAQKTRGKFGGYSD